jgi:hypothetical protein
VTLSSEDLGPGGRSLWDAVTEVHELDAGQQVQLLEACRAKDRLDRLDRVLSGDADTWMTLTHRLQTEDYELKIDAALAQANATANLMKQLLAALRLPDAKTGKQPQRRGARGAYKPSGSVTAMDKFRQASGG